MSKFFKLNLQLFADGSAAAAADSTGDGATADNALAMQTDGEDLQAEFDGLVADNGKYKLQFDSRVKAAINDRVKNLKGYKAQVNATAPILQLIGERYGVDPRDIQGLQNALLEDSSYLEKEAMDQGLTPEQLRDFRRLEFQNRQFAQRDAEQRAMMDYQRWLTEAEDIKATLNPGFNLDAELGDPSFREIMKVPGMTLKNAYMAIHGEDLMRAGMKYATQKAAENAVNDIKARGMRPQENGTSSVSTAQTSVDISKLTPVQIKKVTDAVMRGEKVTPENIAKYI